jgi:hypothetical protein
MALTKVSTGVVDMSGNTGGLVIPVGAEADRPASPSIGMIRESTETTPSKVEVYTDNGGAPDWQFLKEAGPSFIPLTVDYLVIAGGAGGGIGGGGAGGYRTSYAGSGSEPSGGNSAVESILTLATGSPGYTVTIGAGGAGVVGNSTGQASGSGSNSTFATITSTGGGGGGTGGYSGSFNAGVGGGSGGGSHNNYAVGSGTINQGSNGGNGAGGGGGGALTAGYNDVTNTGGNGGLGISSSITSASIGRAGGGGGFSTGTASEGGGAAGNPTASNATPNKGGGGGGGINGGQGGSGIVILRYPYVYTITFQTGVGFISSTATLSATSEKVTTITAGSGTITFALTP